MILTNAFLAHFTGLALAASCSLHALGPQRVPWTTSNIHGTPEPALPFVTERVFPELTFLNPLDVAVIPGTNRLVVAEQSGRFFSFDPAVKAEKPDPFFDLRAYDPEIIETYALAFHPRFAENRFVFVWANLDMKGEKNRENGSRIIRFKVSSESAPRIDPTTGTLIFSWVAGGHNGGNLRFGPDGMLYLGTGDASPPDPPDPRVTGQDISDVLSSILRIDVDHPGNGLPYGIPKDNPFVAQPGARGEVWAYGLRNPWRMSFNPKNGDLFVGDVGWELWEMIYRIKPAGNYGWSLTEGSRQDVKPDRLRGPSPVTPPLVAHSHEEAASITGGEFYHGSRLPELAGSYIYGDWQMGTFWSLRTEGDTVKERRELARSSLMPAAFGLGPDGELLICDHSGGGLWRLKRNALADQKTTFPRNLSETGIFTQTASQTPSPGVVPYSINATRWADHATSERWAAFPGDGGTLVSENSKGVLMRGQWSYPEGAVLVKTYSLEMERGNPASSRRVETQILHFDGSLWGTYSYRWNIEQTDAELVPARGAAAIYTVKDKAAPGGESHEPWRFFSRAECSRCHSMWNNFAPGFNTLQLDKTTAVASGRQTDLFAQIGLIPEEPRLTDPYGIKGTLEVRARSYLHANCGTCHRYNGGGAVPIYLNIEVLAKEMKIHDVRPIQGDLGLPEARLLAKGDPERSVLLYRMATGGRGHMPYLGGRLVDDRGLQAMRDWIASMKPNPKEIRPETLAQRQSEQAAVAALKKGDAASLDALLSTGSGALGVLLALVDGSFSEEIRAQVIAKGSVLADPIRRDLFERFLPESKRRSVLGVGFNPEVVLRATGDAARGKALFAGVCIACHQIEGVGVDFGPALDRIGTKWNREALLQQILEPSKLIDPEWQLATLEMKGGDSKTGFVIATDSTETRLKIAGGLSATVPSSEILKTTLSKISAMPEALLAGFTAQEAADLLEYLGEIR
ncbi:MAG: mono- and diheme variant protein [Verrucomicrobia bacterium]|nr:MAG: mono- and diheme variant protein [Verrucomicrobiota bacterium]